VTDDTAPCRECTESIPAAARRCPLCGYDPSPGLLGTIGALLAWPFAALGALLVVTALGAFVTGALSGGETVGALGATAVTFGLPWWYILRHRRKKRETATEGSG